MTILVLLQDSGGPLQCDNKLVGLASFGVQCGFALELPGVFADVYFYRQWIIDNMSAGLTLKTSDLVIFVGLFVTTWLRF